MRYYCMQPDFRKEITGQRYPQKQEYYNLDYSEKGDLFTAHLVHTYNATFVNRSRYYDKIYSKYPSRRDSLEGLKLHSWSKPSDVISCAMVDEPHLVVSKKFTELLKTCDVSKYHINKATIYWRKKLISDYYIFYLLKLKEFLPYVDLERSEFCTYKNVTQHMDYTFEGDFVESFNCRSEKELLNVRNHKPKNFEKDVEYKTFCSKVYLRNTLPENRDILILSFIPYVKYYKAFSYCYSERFVEKFLSSGLTGVEFELIDELFVDE